MFACALVVPLFLTGVVAVVGPTLAFSSPNRAQKAHKEEPKQRKVAVITLVKHRQNGLYSSSTKAVVLNQD